MNTARIRVRCHQVFLLAMLIWLLPAAGLAQEPDRELAETIYAAASASVAAYSDAAGRVGMDNLEQLGWNTELFQRQVKTVDAHVLIGFRHDDVLEEDVYILAFRGTDRSLKDFLTDMSASLVPLDGSSGPDGGVGAGIAGEVPKVHSGFKQVAETALQAPVRVGAGRGRSLAAILQEDRRSRLVITGYNFGGAAAVLYGAMLIDGGINPTQLQVVTFGAPPPGNVRFKETFEPRLKIYRVATERDLVTRIFKPVTENAPRLLQMSSYVPVGTLISVPLSWEDDSWQREKGLFFDYGIRSYYHHRTLPAAWPADESRPVVAVLPVVDMLHYDNRDRLLMHEVIRDLHRDMFQGWPVMGEEACQTALEKIGLPIAADDKFSSLFDTAVAAGRFMKADYVLITEMTGKTVRQNEDVYVGLTLTLIKVKDAGLVWSVSHVKSTRGQISPLAAVLADRIAIRRDFTASSVGLLLRQ